LRCWGAEIGALGQVAVPSTGLMEVILPQRLAMHKRGEETQEHASSSQPVSTVPGVHWEVRGVICLPGRPFGLPCPGCCVYSLLSTSMLNCCSCSNSRPGSSVSCPLVALPYLQLSENSAERLVLGQKPPCRDRCKSSCLFCTLTLLHDPATCLLIMSPKG